MRIFNKLLIVLVYILIIAVLVRLEFFAFLFYRTYSGSTYLENIIKVIGLIGVFALWINMIQEGLHE